ncbi:Uncharacterized protein MCB1EB_0407 [Mycoavidus cysteinexigens]|uniref:Uncharacterized protein n=1 Tax=Mycoavidus cysteinexigens TaxID=1553431 RepID=A0A2Z6ET61_9BURK|nr:DUF2612 domain-containing protein [Mycoavidus cysteinexigens]BBE08568.1 Uncharacterized protein MCB1EB_0407 [Mycoavidus cysteinexigens]GAM52729.1 phage-related protein [bacterium endosymbiont of Mortierella elongata FMR23-6]GLR00419.1 hypothetical protein GCM10007934_02300 [Mycoavidus cysteinexigens]
MSYESLLIWQYKGKPKARATAQLIDHYFSDTWQGLADLPNALHIETASGKNLDLVGQHVGQSRILKGLAPRHLFGFERAPGAQGLSRTGLGGGKWYRKGDVITDSVVLDDDDFRFLIKCRIAKNHMTGTVPDITQALDFIFGGHATVYDQYDMSFTVTIRSDQITAFKRYAIQALDILPRPAGVNVKYVVLANITAFGFAGSPGAFAFNQGKFARYL